MPPYSPSNRHYTLSQSLKKLAEYTGRSWTREEFYDALRVQALPVHSAPPYDVRVVLLRTGIGEGKPVDADIGWRLALLLPHQVEQLRYTGLTATRTPAWKEGDAEYETQERIMARRLHIAQAQAVIEQQRPDSSGGPWMGESEVFFFHCDVLVSDPTVQVPEETIDELVRFDKLDNGARSSLSSNEMHVRAESERHEPKLERQERLILTWLADNGITATKLPRQRNGTPGIKYQVRAAMLRLPADFTDRSFDKAWDRLRARGAIADDEIA